jgi:hypothetical protein
VYWTKVCEDERNEELFREVVRITDEVHECLPTLAVDIVRSLRAPDRAGKKQQERKDHHLCYAAELVHSALLRWPTGAVAWSVLTHNTTLTRDIHLRYVRMAHHLEIDEDTRVGLVGELFESLVCIMDPTSPPWLLGNEMNRFEAVCFELSEMTADARAALPGWNVGDVVLTPYRDDYTYSE